MASLSPPPPALSSATTITTSFLPHFRNKKHHPSSFYPRTKKSLINRVSCTASNGGQDPSPDNKFERRDMLVGLGGLYGASTLTSNSSAFANPIITPPFNECRLATLPDGTQSDCCPPPTKNIKDYKPIAPPRLRVRPAAHLVDSKYVEKYERAVALMKSLPEDDPRSFKQQANIHCAYCNGGYDQLGLDVKVQVHDSWLFLPFHRYYLYFHEKILGELIGDPNFALPFWNYDAPAGMRMPAMYADKHSPLYDELRNQKHLPPALVDLDFNDTDQGDENAQIKSNLGVMYRQIVSGARKPLLFFGGAYRAGQTPPGAGTLENLPHSPIHAWCGDPDHHRQNMGVLYSAARDPIFYAHHSNVDRMWLIWKSLGPNRKDISDPDFLNTSFIFYNEKAEPVRVYIRDSLNTKNLGYVFQTVNIPWIKARPMPRNKKPKSKKSVAATIVPFGIGTALAEPTSIQVERPGRVEFPVTLNKIVSTEVSRPKKSRSKKEKDEEEEVLLIEGIEYEGNVAIKFDVFINDEDDREIRPDNTEFAGSFVNLPHINGNVNMKMKTSLRLGITEMLEDLDVDDDEVVVVTLVPRLPADGTSPVIINDIKIEYEG